MKKIIEGYLFNRVEEFGGKEFEHIGFEGDHQSFGELMASLVPEKGMKLKAKLIIETFPEDIKK